MSKGSDEKCISPWFGLGVILLVCVIVMSAVFFEFKTSRHKRASTASKVRIQRAVTPVDQGAGNSIVF